MEKITRSGAVAAVLIVALFVFLAPPAESAVPRITQSEIYVVASSEYSTSKDMKAALWGSLDRVKESGGSAIEIMAGLTEVLMRNGLGAGQDALALSSEIAGAVYSWAVKENMSAADTARLLSQAILGIRTVAQSRGLDMEQLMAQLQRDIAALAGEQGQVMARVVGSSFEEDTVQTYTPVGYSFLADAAKVYRARKAIDSAVDGAFAGAEGEGLKAVNIASGLGETLMMTGLDIGVDGPDLAAQIICAVVRWMDNQDRFGPGKARVTMEAVAGIRSVASREGFDNPMLQNRVQNAIDACSGSSTPVVQSQFDSPVALGVPEGVLPPIPPGTPPDVDDDFDPPQSET